MGRLEKVGAAVVGVLLCIIIVVGLLNKNDGRKTGPDASRESALIKPGDGEGRRADPAAEGEVSIDELLRIQRLKRERELREAEARKAAEDVKDSKGSEIAKGETKPGPEPKAEPETIPPTGAWPKDYEVKSGDILGRICVEEYGSAGMVPAVLAANPGLDPKRLRIGQKISLPAPRVEAGETGETPAAVGERPARGSRWSFITPRHLQQNTGGEKLVSTSGGRLYTVKKGDTLSGIAQREMGSVKHVTAIVDANKRILSSAKTPLQIGWQLELPNLN